MRGCGGAAGACARLSVTSPASAITAVTMMSVRASGPVIRRGMTDSFSCRSRTTARPIALAHAGAEDRNLLGDRGRYDTLRDSIVKRAFLSTYVAVPVIQPI